jgi:hypothetical protein
MLYIMEQEFLKEFAVTKLSMARQFFDRLNTFNGYWIAAKYTL